MTRKTGFFVVLAALAGLSGCEADRMSEKGFSLPEGNALAGREAFVYLHCHECHTVVGEEFPAVAMADPPFVELGGKGYPADQVTNNGEQSKMPVYNGYMTVQELVDIVAFLQPHYDVFVPQYEYRIYP